MDKDKLSRNLREKLKSFNLYSEADLVFVNVEKNNIHINYSSSSDSKECNQYFELGIMGGACNIYSLYIEEGKEYRSLLADIIEKFCYEEFNCRIFTTIPSNISKRDGFWEKKGFRYLNAIVVEKVLSR